jgi:hypothetical protein
MPRVLLMDACGMAYRIDTLGEGQLQAWLDEWLPKLWPDGDQRMVPRVNIQPLWRGNFGTEDPDWLCDTRVMGDSHPFPARDGMEGMRVIEELRQGLEAKLARIKEERGR